MRTALLLVALVVLAAACGSMDYRDSNAAADANPLCTSRGDRPGEPASRDCERVQEGSWSSDAKNEPIDFRKDDDDD